VSQVLQFPQATQAAPQAGYPPAYEPSYLPALPTVAMYVDQHARRIPWYVWAVAGAFFMFRIVRRVR
jgi:hypothetical protein